ncbi:flagellar basal body protein, partial [Acinetobacter baumannii]
AVDDDLWPQRARHRDLDGRDPGSRHVLGPPVVSGAALVSVILDAALSGLKTSQRQLDLTSHNIANVNTPGYHKRSLTQFSQSVGGIGQGS